MRAEVRGEQLILEVAGLRRVYRLTGGLTTLELSGPGVWPGGEGPDLRLPGEAPEGDARVVEQVVREANAAWARQLRVTVDSACGSVEVRRVFRLYPGVAAIACDLWLRGRSEAVWRGEQTAPVVDRLLPGQRHLTVEIARFFDLTDRRNNLTQVDRVVPYRHPTQHAGNVLLALDAVTGEGLWLLREAPCSDIQLAWSGYDFQVSRQALEVVGLGVDPPELDETEWLRAYGWVVGLTAGGELGARAGLRAYQRALRSHRPDRDEMVMANTWGDRSQDARVAEEFILAELEAAAAFGVSHLQIDDGWQKGLTANSAEAGGTLDGIWDRDDYWTPRPERFPRGLAPLVERGRELGLELGLWFNPSRDESYAHWADDARTLIRLHRELGLRIFKIDGVDIPDKRADVNLRRIFDTVLEATDHEVTFNLDATAHRRFGYHYLNEYGTIFLENRYTDWGNYYPHWTLRNLWQLARWVPPQNLQIEFLNTWRNGDKYPPGDPLAPAAVGFEYAFAVTLAAQPLAWFEVQHLPPAAAPVGELVRRYRQLQPDLHRGLILPVGEEPSGGGWTGFQSLLDETSGYLLLYRELTDRQTARLPLWGAAGRLEVECLLGHGASGAQTLDPAGGALFALPSPWSWGLYRYRLSR